MMGIEDMFGGIFGEDIFSKNSDKVYEEPELNKELIQKLYTAIKGNTEYKLYPTKSGSFKIFKDEEFIEEFYDIFEAKKECIIYSLG